MDHVISLAHPDGASGISIFSDGTKAYWSDGRGSRVQIVYPDGRTETITSTMHDHPVNAATNEGMDSCRPMTKGEVAEYDAVRHGNGIEEATDEDADDDEEDACDD